MNIVVDVGNTRMKYACFDGVRFVEVGYEEAGLFDRLKCLRESGEQVDVLLSGSGQVSEEFRVFLAEWADCLIEASPLMPLPLKIVYSTRETLGFDRIAICIGACELFPGCPLLVIDTGTCLTFNCVDGSGTFLGGNISPGVEMRFRSMHAFTARLPYVTFSDHYEEMGHSTEQAIQSGVMNGIFFEVESYVRCFLEKTANGKVVMTGGCGRFLSERLGEEVVFNEILGLIGLNKVFMTVKNED